MVSVSFPSMTVVCTVAVLASTSVLSSPIVARVTNNQTVGVGSGGCDASDKSYDFNLLVEQWPISMGATGTQFTLHGMWPSRDGSSDADTYPCQCTNEQFDATQLTSIMSDMNLHWPSYEGANNDFWSHEWGKHGTCTGLTQLNFFSTVLANRAKYDAGAALTKAAIKIGSSYPAGAILKAFLATYGVSPLLGCGSGNTLKEVGWCLDKTATSATACASSVLADHGEFNNCDTTQNILIPDKSSPSPPGPSPPGPSPPGPSNQCVPDKHGPACSSDSDCTSIKDCLRCAHSGYCTSQPDLIIDA